MLGAVGSVAGLLAGDAIYGQETITLADAATAQDIVTLVVVSPLLATFGVRASRGSLTSYLAWLGFLGFTVYNGLIYVFSIHFGPLFLVWVAVLGLSVFALIGGLSTLRFGAASERLAGRPTRRVGWFLIAVAVAFAMLWLGEIVPALLSGSSSSSADDWAVPTNPVHVLDLSFFLPAVVVTGALLLRRRPLGDATVVGQLTSPSRSVRWLRSSARAGSLLRSTDWVEAERHA